MVDKVSGLDILLLDSLLLLNAALHSQLSKITLASTFSTHSLIVLS